MTTSGRLLEGKVVVVTGGANGIGRECALAYGREGATIVIADVDREAGARTIGELTGEAKFVACDVSDGANARNLISVTLEAYRRLDVLHNNAGVASPSKPLHETTEEEWDHLFDVNLKSVFNTTRPAYPALKASGGNILNTASMVGLIGQDNHAAYVATKGAMVSLTKAMALDYAVDGIRVNAVCPAGVWTPMLRRWATEQPNTGEIEQYLSDIHPLGYCPEGDVIADAATFLISDQARFLTGAIIPVSGGAELGYKR